MAAIFKTKILTVELNRIIPITSLIISISPGKLLPRACLTDSSVAIIGCSLQVSPLSLRKIVISRSLCWIEAKCGTSSTTGLKHNTQFLLNSFTLSALLCYAMYVMFLSACIRDQSINQVLVYCRKISLLTQTQGGFTIRVRQIFELN